MKTRKTHQHRPRRLAGALALGGLGLLAAQPAAAFKFEGESVSGSFDSTISLGLQKRLSSPDCRIIGNDNGGCVPVSGTLGRLTTGGDPNNATPWRTSGCAARCSTTSGRAACIACSSLAASRMSARVLAARRFSTPAVVKRFGSVGGPSA